MTLKIKDGYGQFSTLRFNKEGSGEEASTPLYMSLTITCKQEQCLPVILDTKEPPALWDGTKDKKLNYPLMGQVETQAKVEGVTVLFGHLGSTTLKNCRLTCIKFTPKPGGLVELKCNVIIPEATPEQEQKLKATMKVDVTVGMTGGDLVDAMREEDTDE